MIRLDNTYSDYVDISDPKYPAGKAVDASSQGNVDGTPFLAKWMNDVSGAMQALVVAAFGSIENISKEPDNVQKSDVLNAIKKITQDYTDSKVLAEAQARAQGDSSTLGSAKSYTDSKVLAEAQARAQGDSSTLGSAKSYTDSKVGAEAQARAQGDSSTLGSAKSYTDSKILISQSSVNGETGYVKWSNGLLLQWGTTGVAYGQQIVQVYFPLSFKNGYSIAGMAKSTYNEKLVTFSMTEKTNSYVKLKRWKDSSFYPSYDPVYYIAIGK